MCNKATYLFVLVLAVGQISYAGLVAHWNLDEGSGTATTAAVGLPQANGTLVGATWITTGLAPIGGNSAAVFFNSAKADRIETNYPGILGQASRSVTAWIRAEPVQANSSVIVGWGANTATERYSFRLNKTAADGVMYALRLEIQGSRVIATTPVNDGQWHHVAVTHGDGALINQVTFYVDGKLDARSGTAGGGLINTASTSVVLGNSGHNTTTYGYDGAIDDVRIYDHALSDAEILSVIKGQPWPYAYGPNPANGELLEDTWVSLSWKPGDFAVSHNVYLGDNLADVNAGTGDTFRGNQTGTSLFVGFPGNPYPNGLVPGTTYYWRIDEVNEQHPDSPWKGKIWSFSIAPTTAYNPNPADGTESVALDAKLSWTPGFGAKLHTVYLGDDFETVSNAAGGVPQGMTTYTPSALQAEKVYYWRVDEFDGVTTYKGNVWAFTTPGAARSLKPANGAAGVQMTTKLSWTPATNATSHDVYFGTDKDAVKNATTASPQYKGNKAKGSEDYDPGKLAWYTPYYWRVDAVYATGTVKGLVWSFTTADFIAVDDFESYNDIDPPDPASNRIFDKWVDGFATPTTNGALAGNDIPPYAERTVVHSGAQSMPYRYDNTNKTSEATMTLVYPRDWTEEGVAKLSLWFRGAAANGAEKMYVALNGGTPVYHADPKAAQAAGWTEWVIDLSSFQGVTLTNISTISIGFGTKGSPAAAGGTGKVFFDDIRLIRP